MAKLKRNTKDDFKQSDVQIAANTLLENVFQNIRNEFSDISIQKRPEEDQLDRGIDFQVEMIDKTNSETFTIFKLQNKGSGKPLKALTNTEHTGYIPFQISIRHVHYYRQEIDVPLLYTVCDNTNQKVYWHPIQTDDTIDQRVEEAKKKKTKSVQLYIDPKKELCPINFSAFMQEVDESRDEQFSRRNDFRNNPLTESTKKFEVDRSKALLDQVNDVLEYLYDEINYLPIHLLIKNYPFQLSESFTPSYYAYKLITDNESLLELFASINVNTDQTITFTNKSLIENVDRPEEKTISILKTLTRNHIYWLSSPKRNKEISTQYFYYTDCNCVTCRYYRLDLIGTMNLLKEDKPDGLIDGIKYAYMHYSLGNYYAAAKLLESKAIQAKKEKKGVLYLITQFNLLKLAQFLRNNYYDNEQIAYADKLELIKLDNAVLKSPHKGGYKQKILLWIKEQRFFYQPLYNIHRSVSNLRDTYQSHIEGGHGSVNYFIDLTTGYSQLNSFVNGNYIIYDKFSDYTALTEAYIEGLFASYSMKDDQSNMITKFRSYQIQRLVFDGNHKSIWRYFNKYHLKSIIYEEEPNAGKLLLIVKNLLLNNHLINATFDSYSPEDGGYWRSKYPTIFCNVLCVSSILKMVDSDVSDIAGWLIECITNGSLHSPDCYEQVNSFLKSKRRQLSTPVLEKLIKLALIQTDLHSKYRIEILADEIQFRGMLINLNSTEQDALFALAFDSDNDRNFNISIDFYPIAETQLKKEIASRIKLKLSKLFDPYLFYYAVVKSVLPFQSEYLPHFIERAFPNPRKHTFRSFFYGNEDNRFPLFDMLLNLCFKNNISLQDLTERNFCGFGDYYDWLLNMETFDYEKFKLSWLTLYPTKYYFNEFRKHPIIKRHLEAYLITSRDPQMERLYFDICNPAELDS